MRYTLEEDTKPKLTERIVRSMLKPLLYFFGGILLTKKEYDDLQNELKTAKEQLRIMIEEPDSFEGIVITKRHYMSKAMEEAMWFGFRKKMETTGILSLIEPK